MSLSVIWFFSATRDHLSVSCHVAFLPLRSATPAQCQSIPTRQKPGCFDLYYLRVLYPITLQKLLSGASVLLPNYDHMCFFMTQNQKQYFMQKWTVPFSAPSCKKVISIKYLNYSCTVGMYYHDISSSPLRFILLIYKIIVHKV